MAKLKAAVVFVHGLSKKPAPKELEKIWLFGLERDNPAPTVFQGPNEGIKLKADGVNTSFCYYADVFYGEDYEQDFDSYYEHDNPEYEILLDKLEHLEEKLPVSKGVTPREQAFIRVFEARLDANLELHDPADAAIVARGPKDYEIAGFLPKSVRKAIIKKAAMEAYYFLFDKEYTRGDGTRFQVRKVLRDKLINELKKASEIADKVIIVAHSMGTMVAYDVLRNCHECVSVGTLITLGSPLGLREVQAELTADGAAKIDFPAEKLGSWINIYDPLDPVCGADPRFANDFLAVNGKEVTDIRESNWGSWRHTITHYLSGTEFRAAIASAAGIAKKAAA